MNRQRHAPLAKATFRMWGLMSEIIGATILVSTLIALACILAGIVVAIQT